MANTNKPTGLIPVRHLNGNPYNGAYNIYFVPAAYATALYLGLPLIATGVSDANGVPVAAIATAGATNYTIGPMVGIVDGGEPIVTVTRDMPLYHPASTAQYILVADDPDLVFEAQEDSVGGSIAMASAGTKNVDLVAGAGSNASGYSGWMLDSSTVAVGATLQCRLLRGVERPDNTMGSSYAKWLVRINLHSMRNPTGI